MLPANQEAAPWLARLGACVTTAVPPALRIGAWLLRIIVPVSFAVLLLKTTGLLDVAARLCEPAFSLLGLPGEAALVFLTSCLLGTYSSIAVMGMLDLTTRTVTILALMSVISHNLLVEAAVQRRTGSRLSPFIILRLCASFAGALALGLLLPAGPESTSVLASESGSVVAGFGAEIRAWFDATVLLVAKVMVIVTVLMVMQRILEEFGVIRLLSRMLKYPLLLLGLPHETAFLWIVANTLGLGFGAGVIIDHVERGHLSKEHANILNYHIAISHSLLEDTLVFVAIGVSAWWITVPRLLLAGLVVWLKRLFDWAGRTKPRRPAPDACQS
jgi:hypothetical protein